MKSKAKKTKATKAKATKVDEKTKVDQALEMLDNMPERDEFNTIVEKCKANPLYAEMPDDVREGMIQHEVRKVATRNAKAKSDKSGKHLVDYKRQVGDVKQKVVAFGSDNKSLNAKDSFTLFCYLVNNKKKDAVLPSDLASLIQRETGFDMRAVYGKAYPDSPIHQGMHSLSKNGTNEHATGKSGHVDTFARGERQLVLKDTKVSINNDNGHYYPNNRKKAKYFEVGDARLRAACEGLVSRVSKAKLALA